MESQLDDIGAAGRGGSLAAAVAWLRRNADVAALGAVLLGAGFLLLYLGRNFTFIQDSWSFLLDRRDNSLDAFLLPHNEHIVVVPVAIEKLLISLFGMTSAAPERLLMTAMLLTTAALLFVYVRRRVGGWPAVLAAALLLFLGPAWSVLLWPFEIVLVGSALFGIAMLLALDRDDGRGDLLACVLLTLSVGFSSLGVPFIAAAAVDVFQRRRERGLRRVWVGAIPLLLYLAWYAGWGHTAESHLSLQNVLNSPKYMLDGLASSLDSLLGLSTLDVNSVGQPDWGRPLLVAAVALIAFGQSRKPGFSPRLWPLVAAAASYWLLAGFNYFPGREAVAGRYGYAGAIFVLLIAAELLRGVRLSRRALLVATAVAIVAVASNLAVLREGKDWLERQSIITRADTAAIEIASRTVAPSFTLTPDLAGTGSLVSISAEKLLPATRADGSPAYSPAELETAPELAQRRADIVLVHALPLSSVQTRGVTMPANLPGCVTVPGGKGAAAPAVVVGPGVTKIGVAAGPPAEMRLRRFTVGAFPVKAAALQGESVTRLRIPRDNAPQPWYVQVEAAQTVRVCPPIAGR